MQTENKYFASANTEKGFVSYYEEIYGGLDMVYVIKGGPGTGKSRLMREIADGAEAKGISVEYFYCSSDPLSLDGIILTELRTAVIDGTAPHTYDPKIPGVKDKIINLGENWDEGILRKNAEEICSITKEKSGLYCNVYNYLAAAGRVDSEIRMYNRRAVLFEKMQGAVDRLSKGWKNGKGFKKVIRPVEGISHAGHIVYGTYHNFSKNKYVIRDRYGVGNIFTEMLMKTAEKKGLLTLYSPSFLDNSRITAICFPELGSSFVIDVEDGADKRIINMDRFVDLDIIRKNKQKNRFAVRCLSSLYEGVQKNLDEIYELHSSLENHYISAMDFSKNDEIARSLKKEIFG